MAKTKGRVIKRIFIYLFIVAVVALAVVIYAMPGITGAMTETLVAEYGSMQVTDDVTCYFVRQETVCKAESSGYVKYYLEEGSTVRKGVSVLSVFPEEGAESGGKTYLAAENGLISYHFDGYEETFTPDTMKTLKFEDVDGADFSVSDSTRNFTASSEALYKLVDDDTWYTFFWVPTGNITKYTKGASVTLELPLGSVKGRVNDILDAGDQWLVVLEFRRYYEGMLTARQESARVITADYEGLLIPNKSITTEDGQVGVYVKTVSEDYVFTPISVITSNGEISLVENGVYYDRDEEGNSVKVNTVKAYDEILKEVQQYGD